MSRSKRQSHIQHPACPVCGVSTEQRIVYEKWGYPILVCSDCRLGTVKVDQRPDPAELYNRGYFQGKARDGYADYAGSEAVLRREFRGTLEYLTRNGPRSGRLLEIGCAHGFFLMEAQVAYQCTGIDVAREAIDSGRLRGLDVHCEEFSEAFLNRTGPFDAVVMLDVIEHLADPAGTLELAHRALVRGGWILLTTGDWDSLLARLAGRRWRLMTPPQHLFFFSRKTLTSMLNRIGFEVVECRKPWKRVPLGLAAHQLFGRAGIRVPFLRPLSQIGIPVNLFDAVRVLARRAT
jgi:SAM-dependent methyltransferase